MDPLSVTASVLAIVTAAEKVSKVISALRQDWVSFPGRLHALHNEVDDLESILRQVARCLEARKTRLALQSAEGGLLSTLWRGKEKLDELQDVLDRLLPSSAAGKRDTLSRVIVWRKEQSRVSALQEDIKGVKANLNVLLGASNS